MRIPENRHFKKPCFGHRQVQNRPLSWYRGVRPLCHLERKADAIFVPSHEGGVFSRTRRRRRVASAIGEILLAIRERLTLQTNQIQVTVNCGESQPDSSRRDCCVDLEST